MKEILVYNKDDIRNATFHYEESQKDLDIFMKMIIKDSVMAEITPLSKSVEE